MGLARFSRLRNWWGKCQAPQGLAKPVPPVRCGRDMVNQSDSIHAAAVLFELEGLVEGHGRSFLVIRHKTQIANFRNVI